MLGAKEYTLRHLRKLLRHLKTMRTRKQRYTRRRLGLLLQINGASVDPIQRGGYRCPRKSGIVSADGFRYKYSCYEYDTNTLIFNGGNGRPCFVLEIKPSDGSASLITLERNIRCSMDTGATTQTAGRAAFALAKEMGVTTITLTDNASKHLNPGNTAAFVVSDMEFLSQGKTWYETFLPVRPTETTLIENWRHRVLTNAWSSVYSCLRQHQPDIVIPVSIEDVPIDQPGSAMEVFRRIKRARTDFFVKYRFILPMCSGIQTLYGTSWVATVK